MNGTGILESKSHEIQADYPIMGHTYSASSCRSHRHCESEKMDIIPICLHQWVDVFDGGDSFVCVCGKCGTKVLITGERLDENTYVWNAQRHPATDKTFEDVVRETSDAFDALRHAMGGIVGIFTDAAKATADYHQICKEIKFMLDGDDDEIDEITPA